MALRRGKRILSAVVLIVLMAGILPAQAVNPNALKAFQASSGGAAATWNAGPSNSWEATWAKEGQKMVYCYDQNGLLQQKKNISNVASFPANVNSAITAAYPKGNIQYAYKVIDRSNQKYYEVQVANGASLERMRYSLEGKPVGKTSLAATQPITTQPVASVATPTPASNAVKPAVATPAKPAPAMAVATPTVQKAVTPAASTVVAKPTPATPAVSKPNPATVASTPVKPVPQPMAMRGEAASTTATAKNSDLIDDDLGDLLEDEGDMDDLFNDDENWDDVNLEDDLEDDSDLLDGTDDLDVGDDLDLDDLDDDDGF